jgi:hypothetical protein
MKKREILKKGVNLSIEIVRFGAKSGVGVLNLKGHIRKMTDCVMDCSIGFANRVLDNKEV